MAIKMAKEVAGLPGEEIYNFVSQLKRLGRWAGAISFAAFLIIAIFR